MGKFGVVHDTIGETSRPTSPAGRGLARIAALLWTIILLQTLPAVAEVAPPNSDILWTETKRYSFLHEELIIRDFFQDRRDGFFVDVGCAWPIKNSNTYYLEKHLGWSGIGVDALPDFARGWAQQRPRSTFLNYLVTDHSDALAKFYKVAVWGLSTAEADIARSLDAIAEIEVPSMTLDDILERYGATHIDFLSIDVEWHQEPVLAGFDLERWRPELVCIEDDGGFSVPWFKERGYLPIERYRARDIVNWYFAPAELAMAANARQTERGREEIRKREEALAREPRGAPLRLLWTPKYLLGPDGMPVFNTKWELPPTPTPTPVTAGAAASGRPSAGVP